jgi:predicted metalloprotease
LVNRTYVRRYEEFDNMHRNRSTTTNIRYAVRLVLVAALCGLLVAGCSSQPFLPPTSITTDTGSAQTTGSVGPTCRPPSLAHCYTEASMQRYIDAVLPMINKFFRAKYAHMTEPRQYIFIAVGNQANSACAGDSPTANTYAYCPTDQNVYLGQAEMWKLYNEDGDAAPAVGLAHEWGHNIQNQVGVPAPTTDSESVNYENQADCVAGAWIQYAIQQGWFEQADVDTTDRLLATIADAENPNRTHGDLSERTSSLSMGIQGGLAACNSFFPDTPIYTSA